MVISITALIVSIVSLSVATLSYWRDASRLKVRSYLFYDYIDKPSLRILMVNSGRRPIYLKCISFEYESGTSQHPLKFNAQDYVKTDENNLLIGIEPMLAHNTTIRLGEGEAYEEIVKYGDHFNILHIGEKEIEYAKNIWVEDILGKKYKIKNIMKVYNEFMQISENA